MCRSVLLCFAVQPLRQLCRSFVSRVSLRLPWSAAMGACRKKPQVLCRVFPPAPVSNKKAELAADALGLQAVILFRSYSTQLSGTRSFSRQHSGRDREGLRATFSQQLSSRERDSSRGSLTLSNEISSPVLQPGVQSAVP